MKLTYKSLILASGLVLSGSVAAFAAQPASAPAAKTAAAPADAKAAAPAAKNDGQLPPVSGPDAGEPAMPVINALSASAKPDSVVAVIDGKKMTLAELDKWAKFINPSADMPVDQRRLQVLRLLVTMQAFSDAAKADKLDTTPDFKDKMALMTQSALQQAYVDKTIMTPIPDSELKARYDKEVAAMPKETEIHAEHILVKTKPEAEAIIAQLNKGANFETLAKEKSLDGTASLGGDLGYFTRGQMVDAFDKAAFALKKGEYTKQPVQTQFGWHVIKVLDVRQKEPPKFDEMKLYLQNMILRDRYQSLQRKLLEKYKATYPNAEIAKAMALRADDDTAPGDE